MSINQECSKEGVIKKNEQTQITSGAYSETITPKRPSVELFEPFLGDWKIEGKNSETAQSPGAVFTGKESFEWLPGDFFIVSYWHRSYEDKEYTGIGIMGFEATNDKYFFNMFDNFGNTRSYEVEVLTGMILIWGLYERASIFLDDSQTIMDTQWEHKKDGKNWLASCEMKARKLSS